MISQLPHKLEDSLRSNPLVSELLSTWVDLDVPNCWLVAGTVVQSYWNAIRELPPLHGVSDVDLISYDGRSHWYSTNRQSHRVLRFVRVR
jgi:hypothetical protein